MSTTEFGLPKEAVTSAKQTTRAALGVTPGAPMELLGIQPGISVIDQATVLKRQWYFDGKFLRAEGFRLDQEYVRELVALSNLAVGHGIVEGFEARLEGANTIAVTSGLALARSGKVIHLPSGVDLSIATLLDRATGSHEPGDPGQPGAARFDPCPPDRQADGSPDTQILSPRPLYVLTVSPTEALCGEEERFGQLCEDACATETDRSLAVEGVVFRVHPVALSLPVSSAVPFSGIHFRSRTASAWYHAEADAIASGISGAGLRNHSIWCNGADGVGGDETALAVFDREGASTSMLDMWTARRELMEGTPQRYWGWRFAMRPLDVFLAQVLQFQCQLRTLAGPTGPPPEEDPCADQRDTLAEVSSFLAAMTAEQDDIDKLSEAGSLSDARSVEDVHEIVERTSDDRAEHAIAQLDRLRSRIADSLTKGPQVGHGSSLMVDGGLIEVPSGGYLPIVRGRDVERQVRALFGPGVDLRFCAVRPDFIAEALQEAQHMERISLTKGIDDPSEIEEVDVLVPNGTVVETDTEIAAFEGRIHLLPFRSEDKMRESGSALTISTVARQHIDTNWSWTLAGYAEAPHQLRVASLFRALRSEMTAADQAEKAHPEAVLVEREHREVAADLAADTDDGADDTDSDRGSDLIAELHVEETKAHEAVLASNEFLQRAGRERKLAGHRVEQLAKMRALAEEADVPDRGIPGDERRPLSLWLDIESTDLSEVGVGQPPSAIRFRGTAYSRATTEPALVDYQLTATQTVVSNNVIVDANGQHVREIVTSLSGGSVDVLAVLGSDVIDPPPQSTKSLELRWRVGHNRAGGRSVSVSFVLRNVAVAQLTFEQSGSPRRIRGSLDRRVLESSPVEVEGWARKKYRRGAAQVVSVAEIELTEGIGTLDLGSPGRGLAETAIASIEGELINRDRDPNFGAYARGRLFEARRDHDVATISTDADWVMFHRRRTKVCAEPVADAKTIRRYRWFHAVIDDFAELEKFGDLLGHWEKVTGGDYDVTATRVPIRLDQLGFEPVTEVEFPEGSSQLDSPLGQLRSAFQVSERGEQLRLGVVTHSIHAEGQSTARARLGTVTAGVSDLVDTSRLRTLVIGEIPAEFHTGGIDGAMFTVGVSKPEQTLACAHIVRGGPILMRHLFGELSTTNEGRFDEDRVLEIATKLSEELDDPAFATIDAKFAGTVFTNESVVSGWAQPFKNADLFLGLTVATQDDIEETSKWGLRRPRLQGALQVEKIQALPKGLVWTSEACAAVGFLVVFRSS